jgi:hypothetical protein
LATPEGLIKGAIVDWLRARKIFCWVNQAGKIPGRKLAKTGVTDILGIYNGRMLAIEVKAPTGKLTDEQAQFIWDVKSNGGLAFVARSVEDVEKALSNWKKEIA